MPARSVGNATISFGLVSIPVKLYTATQATSGVSFNMLHEKCGSRLRQQLFCPVDNEVVERSETVKGYEFSKDRYVTFTPAELKALEEEASEAIEIAEFVPEASVDPVFYDRPYYLSPDKGGDKAYRLLSEVMRRSQKVALARYAARGKQYLVMLRPGPAEPGHANTLVMQQLLYSDEVRPLSDVPLPEGRESDGGLKDAELALAEQLVDRVTSLTFHPEAYRDDVKDRVLKLIEEKAGGQAMSLTPAPAAKAQVIDLMEALKQSLSLQGGKAAGQKPELVPAKPEAAPARKPPKRVGPVAVTPSAKAKPKKS